MSSRRIPIAVAAATALTLVTAGCSGSGDANTLTVAYWDNNNASTAALESILEDAKSTIESKNEDVTVELTPIKAGEGDYATKLALMFNSPKTAPDIVYEDTYRFASDIQAGYIQPIDDYVSDWDDWQKYPDSVRAGVTGADGSVYGIPLDTDTRALWYDKSVLKDAGIKLPWHPKDWSEVVDAAKQIHKSNPDVLPFNIYSGTVLQEASSMQGFEMLLYGTGNTLYNKDKDQWVVGSDGFIDSLKFLETIFSSGLGASMQSMNDTNWSQTLYNKYFPDDKVGISLDGSWIPYNWLSTAEEPWEDWANEVGWTAMPTQDGQDPGKVSMSGGWAFAMGANAKNPDLSFEFMKQLNSKQNALSYTLANASVPVRTDVREDPKFKNQENSSAEFFSSLIDYTNFRPANENYPRVSAEIQKAMESVMTGSATPVQAAKKYDAAVESIVGSENVIDES